MQSMLLMPGLAWFGLAWQTFGHGVKWLMCACFAKWAFPGCRRVRFRWACIDFCSTCRYTGHGLCYIWILVKQRVRRRWLS